MARGCVHRFRVARSRAIAAAVVRRAQMRAAFQDLAGNFDFRQARVVAVLLTAAAGILGNAARLRRVGLMSGSTTNPWSTPRHCRSCRRGRSRSAEMPLTGEVRSIAVAAEIFVRKVALPCIRHLLAAGRELVTPGELSAVEAAARGKLPFGFGRQILAGPFGVGFGVAIGDVDNRMIVEAADRAARPVWPAPVGAELETSTIATSCADRPDALAA